MIKVYDPEQKKTFTEEVYGEKWLRFLYSPTGAWLRPILSAQWVSRIFGWVYSSHWSARWVPEFIQKFRIPMDEYVASEWKSFNDFFIRPFRPASRPFAPASQLPAFAEGRYSVFPIERLDETHQIKGIEVSLVDLLLVDSLRVEFPLIFSELIPWLKNTHLWMAIARLCPTDYHRYHWSDDSKILHQWNVSGAFDSVHPYALKGSHSILFENERALTWSEGKTIGKHLFIDVAALGVGRIIQQPGESFKKGDERGHFLFGGSTVIGIFDQDRIQPSREILERTLEMETFLRLGVPLADAHPARTH